MHDSVRGLAMNVGSDRPLSVLEAIGEIAGSLGMSPERVTYEFVSSKDVYGENYEEPLTRIPEIGLARGKLGWSPDTDLRTGCTNMLAFAAEHGWWIRDGEA
jgi:nucleoside-diphosphate-sugar epimerase